MNDYKKLRKDIKFHIEKQKQLRKILENNDEELAFIEEDKKIRDVENAKELNELVILFIIVVSLLSAMLAVLLTLLN